MKNTLNVGILGCGRISSTYFDCFSNGFDGVNLISVSDLIKFKKDKFIKKFNCKSYDNVNDFLNDNELDTVVILSESGNHYDHAKQALKRIGYESH